MLYRCILIVNLTEYRDRLDTEHRVSCCTGIFRLRESARHLQPACTKKCLRIRVGSTETAVEIHCLVAAALFKDITTERH